MADREQSEEPDGSITRSAATEAQTPESVMGFSVDTIFELLSHRRRRMVLCYCASHAIAEVTLKELVDQVVEWEIEIEGDESVDRRDVRHSLHHIHLPKLEAHGLISWDRDARKGRYRQSAELEHFLDLAVQREPWH